MKKRSQKLIKIVATGAVIAGLVAVALPAVASENLTPTQTIVGNWAVSDLTFETPVRQIESFKVDRDFIVWTEVDNQAQLRRLYAFDGAQVRLLVTMPRQEWDQDYGNGFFDSVEGNYDLSDGLVVWTATDGLDREIWSYNGFGVARVSDNTYDDNHPVTSAGRTAWTSYPGTSYNLMIKDDRGIRRLDGWHVLNYAFSSQNLYWMNRLPQEDWFRVFRENGQDIQAVGKGDDRPIPKYFWTDDNGSAAWEYSTKQWDYDKREVFISVNGTNPVRRVIQRDVPPNLIRIEEVVGNSVVMNVTDLLQNATKNRVALIQSRGLPEYLESFTSPIKIRHVGDGQLVRHLVPDTSSALIIGNGASTSNFILNEHVIHDRFEAEEGLMAGALLKGGLLVRTDNEIFTIPTNGQVSRLAVGDGCVAWLEGDVSSGKFRSACPTIAVRASNGQVNRVAGRLIKMEGNSSVYLAGIDGQRYLFPSEVQFYGWYSDFSSVRTITSTEMQSINLAGTALLRPNYRPVKIVSDPRVYGITGDGELSWITSGDVMTELYGENWEQQVAIISDSSMVDYSFGPPLTNFASASLALAY